MLLSLWLFQRCFDGTEDEANECCSHFHSAPVPLAPPPPPPPPPARAVVGVARVYGSTAGHWELLCCMEIAGATW